MCKYCKYKAFIQFYYLTLLAIICFCAFGLILKNLDRESSGEYSTFSTLETIKQTKDLEGAYKRAIIHRNSMIDLWRELRLENHELKSVLEACRVSVANLTKAYEQVSSSSEPILLYIDLACNMWFSLELAVRFISCPNKMKFVKEPLNCVDFIATVSTYTDLLVYFLADISQNNDYVQFIGLARILRLLRLAKHSSGLKLLAQTFKASAHELLLLVFVVVLGIVLYGTLIFYAERVEENQDNQFDSITHGLWWAIVTMSTIGYGDMVPKTTLGMVVGCFCALTGVLTLALPMPVIVSNFEMFYSHSQARAKLPKEKRQVLAPDQTKMMLMKK